MSLIKCKTGLLSGNPLVVNVLTSPKNFWNLQKRVFILLFHQSGPNWVRKNYFPSDLRFWDCLLRRWLPTTSILVVRDRIYTYQFKSIDLKHQRPFAIFFCIFGVYMKFAMLWKKIWDSYGKYIWSYWLRKMCLCKCIRRLLSENPLVVNMLTSPQNSLNLYKSTFILFFDYLEPNWVRKSNIESGVRF